MNILLIILFLRNLFRLLGLGLLVVFGIMWLTFEDMLNWEKTISYHFFLDQISVSKAHQKFYYSGWYSIKGLFPSINLNFQNHIVDIWLYILILKFRKILAH